MKPCESSLSRLRGRVREGVLALIICLGLPATSPAQDKVTYADDVVPILRNHCFSCHSADEMKADLDLSNFNGVLAGSSSGEIISPGDRDNSFIWLVLNHIEEPYMPPRKPKLPEADLAVIGKWIDGGLLQHSGSKALVSDKPKIDLSLDMSATGKPEGPPPMPNGDLLLEPVLHTDKPGAITALAASPWAPLAAVAGQKQVLLYNLDSLELEGVLPFPHGFPYVIKFSRSGGLLLVGGGIGAKLGKVVLYNVGTGEAVAEVGDELDAVLAADLSPDQTMVALGGSSKTVRIYATSTGELLHTIDKHTEWITSIAFSPDGVLLATGDRNGGVHVWEALTARPYNELKAHEEAITAMAWRDDSNLIGTAGEDGQIMLWELEGSTRVRNWRAHAGGVQALAFSHDGRLVSAGRDRTARLWTADGKEQRAFKSFSDLALAAAISHDMKSVVAGDFTGEIRVWNAEDGALLGHLDANPPTLSQRIAKERQELAALEPRRRVAAEDLKQAKLLLEQASQNLRTQRQAASDAEAAAAAAKEEWMQSQQVLAEAKSARKQVGQRVQTAQANLDATQSSLKRAEENLAAINQKLISKNEALSTARNLEAAATQSFNQAKAAAEAAPDNADLAEALTLARSELDESQAFVSTLKSAISKLQEQAASGQSAKDAAQNAAATAETEYASVQQRLREVTDQFDKSQTRAEELGELHEHAVETATHASNAAADAESAHAAAQETLARQESRMNEILAATAAIEHRLARWQAGLVNVDLIAARQALAKKEALASAWETKTVQLEAESEALHQKLSSLQKALQELQPKVEQITVEAKEARAAAEEAAAELPPLREQHERLQTQYESLKPKR